MNNSPNYKPISAYGLIGNCRGSALVATDGSIDWCCLPRFDSPSLFAAILDHQQGGRFAITPDVRYSSSQRYVERTNVLETTFVTDGGVCTLTDYMPIFQDWDGAPVERHQIVRIVRGESGGVPLDLLYQPRPDYARIQPVLTQQGREVVWEGENQRLSLASDASIRVQGGETRSSVTVGEGQEIAFVLTYSDTAMPLLSQTLEARELVGRTIEFWRNEVKPVTYDGPWRDWVVRSYLCLHLLTYLPTGGIVAASTTSLPEHIGGVRNWDYRYTWLRDATFTIDALIALGHSDEAFSFFCWLKDICDRDGDNFSIMYRVDGGTELAEEELIHLEGYRCSRPVHIGNDAANQRQHDIYGEVVASAYRLTQAGFPISDEQWEVLQTLANLAAARWREPDNGLWEVRGGPFHFVYSKVMCWVALDRAARLARMSGRETADTARWEQEAELIRDQVLTRGWSEKKQAFVQHYDTQAMDASNLRIPLVGFLPADDPRIISTVERIQSELRHGPFIQRYNIGETDDGLSGDEGSFTMCSFWLVRVLAQMGRVKEARDLCSQLLGLANPLGLYSEMMDSKTHIFLGNYPQAFTHIGLILATMDCWKTDIPGRALDTEPEP